MWEKEVDSNIIRNFKRQRKNPKPLRQDPVATIPSRTVLALPPPLDVPPLNLSPAVAKPDLHKADIDGLEPEKDADESDEDVSKPKHTFKAWLSQTEPLQVPINDIGHMDEQCDKCDALLWRGAKSEAFRKNLRSYNSAFAFTSALCKPINRAGSRPGPVCFQIQGAFYHATGPLETAEAERPRYAQLYFYDPHMAAQYRLEANESVHLDPDKVKELSRDIYTSNPYVEKFVTAREQMRQVASDLRKIGDDHAHIRAILNPELELVVEQTADKRRYNLPTSDDVAAILPDTSASKEAWREIVLAERTASEPGKYPYRRISVDNAAYMPLAYPLMWPHGGTGYDSRMVLRGKTRKRQKITLAQYHRYYLYTRKPGELIPFAFRRLFQQYVVDCWAIAEQAALQQLRHKQNDYRKAFRTGLADAIYSRDINVAAIGRSTILPSSFTGSDRFMSRSYQDSMAIVRHFGKPTLFITFTANPNWPEIRRELLPGQTVNDRPDIGIRVFDQKRKELLNDITKHHCFGHCVAVVWTIEYQKRGLPHMHCLVFLNPKDRDRLLDPANIDRVIRAEIPGPDIDPDGRLRKVVESTMIHRPCGENNPNAPCMVNNQCSKKYPKPYCPVTEVKEDGYPIYRRRRASELPGNGVPQKYDNEWVVPYNPYLTRKYQAHINVEICASVRSVKYMNKYLYKGTDRITAHIRMGEAPTGTTQNEAWRDEIQEHLQSRFIGPFEAVYRLLNLHVHGIQPSVEPLAVHLPGQNEITYDPHASVQQLSDKLDRHRTTLEAWFEYNKAHTDGREILYQDFPTHYRWNPGVKWTRYKRDVAGKIGRIYFVHPNAGERFYLRLLLISVPGATGWADLQRVGDVQYRSFEESCRARGLLEDDRYWEMFFEESKVSASGRQLRGLFAYALGIGDVKQPVTIWEKFKEYLCDDLPKQIERFQGVPATLEGAHLDYGLYLIKGSLAKDKNWEETGLPSPVLDWAQIEGNRLIQAELDYDSVTEGQLRDETVQKLNPGQLAAYKQITDTVDNTPARAHFYLQGYGGTGKTFLYTALCHHYRSEGKIVLCVASSGIAALLLPGGRTAHSRFGIPIRICEFNEATRRIVNSPNGSET
ncbi:putative atp-dependent dna helicase pif1 protein [Eutypa lata UCREL1]|uniref:ATP-dependent DNA helicase n=1 Tax=Eutypa lata (strain UCR-EL1) TaxID=1287681 RepID=M7SVI6_EUTLA|nr:putative atp-dependent dna helicase pif1 protein [Eutypa lata UCREL1]